MTKDTTGTSRSEHVEESRQFFMARLRFECDVADVHTAIEAGRPGFILVDARGQASWEQGRIPGAVHLPVDEIAEHAAQVLPPDSRVVTYCWGPGCNGATKAALTLANAGYEAREMIGGFEYWAREGFPVEDLSGVRREPVDPLTAPLASFSCEC